MMKGLVKQIIVVSNTSFDCIEIEWCLYYPAIVGNLQIVIITKSNTFNTGFLNCSAILKDIK